MGRRGGRGYANALLAFGVIGGSLGLPRALSEPAVPSSAEGAAAERGSCGASSSCRQPETNGWQRLVHGHLASRIPDLPERVRVRLAAAISEEAQLAELDPLFVLALIEVESGYDPAALSGRGALGLMQLRPATLLGEAARSRLSVDDPGDPVLNVRAGVRYYRRLLRAFKSHDLALMAYNAGPHRISGCLRSGEVPDRFRSYPRRVLAEAGRLRRLLALELPAPARVGAAVP